MCRVSQALNLTRKKKTLHATEAESERMQKLTALFSWVDHID